MESSGNQEPGQAPEQPDAPGGTPPQTPNEEAAPATRGDIRSLRRWVAVAGVWAVAATAAAIFALVEARDAKDAQTSAANASQADLDRVRSQLRKDLDELSAKVEALPTQSDIARVQGTARKAQRQVTAAKSAADSATDEAEGIATRVDELERKVAALESSGSSDSGGGSTSR